MRDAMAECYVNGTYAKVPEFLLFQQRGTRSVTYLEVQAEATLCRLRNAAADAATAFLEARRPGVQSCPVL